MKFKISSSHFFTRSKGSAPTEPTDPELWVIIYPEKLPKEGTVPDEKKINALTNLPFLEKWVNEDLKNAGVLGWEVKKVGRITYKVAEAIYKIDDGDPVEIPEGREWDSDGEGRWATYGVLERLRRSRFYGICYGIMSYGTMRYGIMRNISVTKAWGYTNEFHMLNTFDKILSAQTHYFVAGGQYIARNEKEIKEARAKDGGAVAIHGDFAHGNTTDDGWITKNLQDTYLDYLRFLAQEKSQEDRRRRKVSDEARAIEGCGG